MRGPNEPLAASGVSGAIGPVAAEQPVPGFSATTGPFQPNRRRTWQDLELACMAHPKLPAGEAAENELRAFN